MHLSRRVRASLVALLALFALSSSTVAFADSGAVRLSIVKGGWFVGANGGGGTLYFHGRRYALTVGGVDAGLVFGLSHTTLRGRVFHIYRPSDIAGVYGAAGAGAAVGVGTRLIRLANDKGAILELEGFQVGLMVNADLSGLVIGLR
jgi:hypothetical protein